MLMIFPVGIGCGVIGAYLIYRAHHSESVLTEIVLVLSASLMPLVGLGVMILAG